MGKFYAVKVGRKTGLFDTWNECEKQVQGFQSASYKSFKTKQEALNYLGTDLKSMKNGDVSIANLNDDEIVFYCDGSCKTDQAYSYGLFGKSNHLTIQEARMFEDDFTHLRNVAGELKGAMRCMILALEHQYTKAYIHYDYEGISSWANGSWKAKNDFVKKYVELYKAVSKTVDIYFIKVKAHTGDKYNELVDDLAKEVLGII